VSALAKLFVAEADSTLFEQHAEQAPGPTVTAEITIHEMRRVAFRKEAAGVLQPGTAEATLADVDADADAGSIEVVEQNDAVEKEFDQVMAAYYRRNPQPALRPCPRPTAACGHATYTVQAGFPDPASSVRRQCHRPAAARSADIPVCATSCQQFRHSVRQRQTARSDLKSDVVDLPR
jgi:hypothetical protein